MASRLKNKVAIITGSGRGMGRTTAERFAAEGAKIVVATRGVQAGNEAVNSIRESGGDAILFSIDLSERGAVPALVAKTIETFAALDVLIHNAAEMPEFTSFQDITDSHIDRMLAVNLKAGFWLVQAALPHLAKSSAGRVIMTSSVAGNSQHYGGLTHYAASKAGLNGFIRSAALDLAPLGITVNGIEPGLILSNHVLTTLSQEQIIGFSKLIPLLRPGRCADIANTMLFLASDESSYITGNILVVDGGISLGPIIHPLDTSRDLDELQRIINARLAANIAAMKLDK